MAKLSPVYDKGVRQANSLVWKFLVENSVNASNVIRSIEAMQIEMKQMKRDNERALQCLMFQ